MNILYALTASLCIMLAGCTAAQKDNTSATPPPELGLESSPHQRAQALLLQHPPAWGKLYKEFPNSYVATYNYVLTLAQSGRFNEAKDIAIHGAQTHPDFAPLRQLAESKNFKLTLAGHQADIRLSQWLSKQKQLNAPDFTPPKEPTLPDSVRLTQGEFEKSSDFILRKQKVLQQQANKYKENLSNYKKELAIYNTKVAKFNKQQQAKKLRFKKLLPEKRSQFFAEALTAIYGAPQLDAGRYNPQTEQLSARLFTESGFLDEYINIDIPIKSAPKIKDNLRSAKIEIPYELKGEKLVRGKPIITYEKCSYTADYSSQDTSIDEQSTTVAFAPDQTNSLKVLPLSTFKMGSMSENGFHLKQKTKKWNFKPSSKKHLNTVVLLIGNKTYGKGVPSVPYAVNDINAVEKYFKKRLQVPSHHIIKVNNATKGQMEGLLKYEIQNRVDRNTKLFVYFSGHGFSKNEQAMLLPSDTTRDSVEYMGYPREEMLKNLSDTQASQIILILDACYTGTDKEETPLIQAKPVDDIPEFGEIPSNINIVAASRGTQVARFDNNAAMSLMTLHLLEGLNGKADLNSDSSISALELNDYLSKTVNKASLTQHNAKQQPEVIGSLSSTIVTY